MRTSFAAFLCALVWTAGPCGARADGFHVDKVIGGASYNPPNGLPREILRSNTEVTLGSISTDAGGSVYGSPGPGSKFRLGPGSEMRIGNNDMEAKRGGGFERDAVVGLSQGKLTAASVAGGGRYDIHILGGQVSTAAGLCVVCIHGAGAHVYVAQGSVTLFPTAGSYRSGGLTMMARPSIAVLSNKGELEIQPLNQVGPGVTNCLLSGASGGAAAEIEVGLPNPANLKGNPPVSETE
jgi:hypothetical protein